MIMQYYNHAIFNPIINMHPLFNHASQPDQRMYIVPKLYPESSYQRNHCPYNRSSAQMARIEKNEK